MSSTLPLLQLDAVRFGYPNRPAFLGPVSLSVDQGQFWAVVGPNGAGKSTLIRVMAGLLKQNEGKILFRGRSLAEMSHRDRARRIGFLPQRAVETPDLGVRDIVLMGRYPFRSMGMFESPHDYQIAEMAMRRTGVAELADRPVATLSGGEAQRTHLAAVLAQEPELLVLDEPTASLDIAHQLVVFDILRGLMQPGGPSVVIVTHDVNLVAGYCTHVVLLHKGTVIANGSPRDVLSVDRLQEVYGVEFASIPCSRTQQEWLVPQRVIGTGGS